MVEIEKIEAFRTKDGRIFTSYTHAEVHEAELRLEELFEEQSIYGELTAVDARDVVIHNSKEIMILLTTIRREKGRADGSKT